MRQRLGLGLAMIAWLAGLGWAAAAEFRSGKQIQLDGDFNDVVFVSGGELAIGAKVMDDIFASGGKLRYTGASADHIITAGGEITFTNAEVKTIVAAGGQIQLNNTRVSNNVIITGGEITIGEGSHVGKSAVIAGGHVTIDGTVVGDVTLRAGEITINGQIDGNADLAAHEIRLGPKAVIGGNLRYRTQNPADLVVSPGATIKGQTTALPLDVKKLKERALAIVLVASVIGLIILAGAGLSVLVLAGVFAGHMQATDRIIRGRIFSTLGVGLLVAVGFPVFFIILLASVIGIPLALVLLAVCIAVQPLALAAVAHATGMAIRGGFGGRRGDRTPPRAGGRVAYALLGLAILVVVGLVPIIGSLVWLVASILGLGATITQLFAALAKPESA
jgi:cytoskeletal protein CcmA (bactofilin family)